MGIGEEDHFLASISPYFRQGLVKGLHHTHVRPTDTRLSSISYAPEIQSIRREKASIAA